MCSGDVTTQICRKVMSQRHRNNFTTSFHKHPIGWRANGVINEVMENNGIGCPRFAAAHHIIYYYMFAHLFNN
jgi:hypothetical protein